MGKFLNIRSIDLSDRVLSIPLFFLDITDSVEMARVLMDVNAVFSSSMFVAIFGSTIVALGNRELFLSDLETKRSC